MALSDESTALMMLAMEVRCLRSLNGWRPVDELIEQLIGAMRGIDSMDLKDIGRLRSWGHRWGSMNPDLALFYSVHRDEESASISLWYILEGRPQDAHPTTKAKTCELWREYAGHDAPCSLFPRINVLTDN